MRRFIFRLFIQSTSLLLPINITLLAWYRQQAFISYSIPFLPLPAKTLCLPVAMAGFKRSDEGPYDAPLAIRRRLE